METIQKLAERSNHEHLIYKKDGVEQIDPCLGIFTDTIIDSTATMVGLAYEVHGAQGHDIKRAFQDAHVEKINGGYVIFFPRLRMEL